jgi:hypothetical protein
MSAFEGETDIKTKLLTRDESANDRGEHRQAAGACWRLKQQSRRGLTDGFANVPKTVPRFTRHRQGCRTGNEGFQSSHQPDNESIAQARSPSSRFFEQGVRFRNHESRSIRREGSRQISRSCRTCCVRVDARAIVPRPINVMRRQISQKGLPLWGNISISC